MKCFVTGATGHIGCVLVRQLISKSFDITVLVRKESDLTPLKNLNIKYIYGDILDCDALCKGISDADIVFHLAGLIEIGSGNYEKLYKINYVGTKNVADICLKYNKRLLYMSSVHAIEELPKNEIMHETNSFDSTKIHGNYGKTKALATEYIYKLGTQSNLNCIIVHPSGIIGPYDYRISSLTQMIVTYSRGKMPAYIEGMYNFVDVRDVCDACITAAMSSSNAECYLLTGDQITVPHLMELLNTITGIAKPKLKIPYFLAVIAAPFAELFSRLTRKTLMFTSYSIRTLRSNGNFDNSKAKSELGFNIRPIYETLYDTYIWLKENNKI